MESSNLLKKIQSVANEIKNIEKDMNVGTGYNTYKAVSDKSVTLAVKKAEAKYGIISIPIKQEIVAHETLRTLDKEGKEKLTHSFIIKMTTRISDIENASEFIEVDSFGHGLDPGDKAFGKASTYARKYALLNVYKIATGEDPDNDPSKKLTVEKDSTLRTKVLNYLNTDNAYKASILTWANIGDTMMLTDEQIRSISETLLKAQKI